MLEIRSKWGDADKAEGRVARRRLEWLATCRSFGLHAWPLHKTKTNMWPQEEVEGCEQEGSEGD